jgi:hypothetical protein
MRVFMYCLLASLLLTPALAQESAVTIKRQALQLGPFTVQLAQDQQWFRGIGAVHLNDWPLRDTSCLPIAPATQTRDGISYQRWKLMQIERVGADQAEREKIILHLTGPGWQSLLQQRENVYGHAYVVGADDVKAPQPATATITLLADTYLGLPRLRLQTQLAVSEGEIDWLLERHSWRPSGDLQQVRYFAQRWGTENGGWDSALDDADGFTTTDAMHVRGQQLVLGQGQPRGFGGPAMDFIYGPRGALALWRDPQQPGAYVRGHVTKRAGQPFVAITDQHFIHRGQQATSPWLNIVANPALQTRRQALNWWTQLWDSYGTAVRSAAGIPEPTPVPTVILESWNLKSGHWFEHQTQQLDVLAARGIKRVVMHTLPHPHIRRNNCANFDYSIADYEGGIKALRAFTDAAKERGMEVYGWGGGSLYAKADLVKENPDWTIQNADGRRFHGGYPGTLVAMDFAHHGFQDWYVGQMLHLHREGGIAGLWLDSWMNLHAFGIDHDRDSAFGGPGPHLDGLISCLRRLSKAGMRFITEGVSPLGLSAGNLSDGFTKEAARTGNMNFDILHQASGVEPDADPKHRIKDAELLYRSSLWWRGHDRKGGAGLSTMDYFASLANKGPIALYDRTTDHPPSRLGTMVLAEPTFDHYTKLNLAYYEVLPMMQHRTLIEGGVLWMPTADSSTKQVLFAYHDADLALGSGFAGWSATTLFGKAAPAVDAAGGLAVHETSIIILKQHANND